MKYIRFFSGIEAVNHASGHKFNTHIYMRQTTHTFLLFHEYKIHIHGAIINGNTTIWSGMRIPRESFITYIYGFTVTKKNGEFCGCFVSQQCVLRNIFVRLIFLFIIIFDTQF